MQTALEGSPSGDAEPPRELALSGVQGTTANPKKRNTKRGKRNIRKITERNTQRTTKTRTQRIFQRKQGKANKTTKLNKVLAPAQEPKRKLEKIKLGTELHIATLNVRGTNKLGKGEQVDDWMTDNKIDILALQETKCSENKRENRKDHTWYFRGHGEDKCEQGVGIIINNKLAKHIEDIEPINERIMYITIGGTLPINIIVVYMPTAVHQSDEKDKCYNILQDTYNEFKNKGPTYIIGDFNARMIYPNNDKEEETIGKYTMFENKEPMDKLTEGMLENRELLVQFTTADDMELLNTMYKNSITKLATYRIDKSTDKQYCNITNKTHAQIDYILVEERWRDTITNSETHTTANIHSDHYPFVSSTRIKLKSIKKEANQGQYTKNATAHSKET